MSGIIGWSGQKSGTILPYFKHQFLGCSYYQSTTQAIAHGTATEITGTWTKMVSSGNLGSNDADPFGKFSGGRWTPTFSGYYLCCGNVGMGGIDDAEYFQVSIRRNGDNSSGNEIEGLVIKAPNTGSALAGTVSGILPLDENDYVSLWVYHDEGATQDTAVGRTHFSVTYVGSSF